VQQAVQDVRQAGRRPVLFAATASELKPYGGSTRKVMTLNTRMDASTLVAPPTTTMPLSLTIWMGEPS
jgi:hypothetical protein